MAIRFTSAANKDDYVYPAIRVDIEGLSEQQLLFVIKAFRRVTKIDSAPDEKKALLLTANYNKHTPNDSNFAGVMFLSTDAANFLASVKELLPENAKAAAAGLDKTREKFNEMGGWKR